VVTLRRGSSLAGAGGRDLYETREKEREEKENKKKYKQDGYSKTWK